MTIYSRRVDARPLDNKFRLVYTLYVTPIYIFEKTSAQNLNVLKTVFTVCLIFGFQFGARTIIPENSVR